MTKNDLILKVDNLSIHYITRGNIIPAIKGISFEVSPGETYGLVGESGCGKTTVAFGIMGYMARNGRISQGRVIFRGEDLTKMSKRDLRNVWGREISMVFQDPDSSLNPSMRVGDQLAEVLRIRKGLSSDHANEKVLSLFELVQLTDPEITRTRYPHQLSGGMKQRVCIAMALALEPHLLIMDEPTTALDVTTEAVVLDIISDLKARLNISILYITHNLGVVAKFCDRVGVIYAGRLVEEATVRKLFKDPRHPYTRGLLGCIPKLGETKLTRNLFSIPGSVAHPKDLSSGCPFSPRCPFFTPGCAECDPELAEIENGHRASCDFRGKKMNKVDSRQPETHDRKTFQPSNHGDADILKVELLKHYYLLTREAFTGDLGRRKIKIKAVDDVSFDLKKAKTLAIVGESGCGKTTLARCIMGFLKPTSGSISLEGQNLMLPVEKRDKGTLEKIAMVFQNPESTLNPKHTVGYAIRRPLELSGELEGDAIRKEAARYLEAVNLAVDYAERYPRELSGGEKQRVAVARAFASNPKMIVCDEPTSALDVSVQASILMLLLDLQTRLGTSYLFISHDLSVVWYLSDYIAVMYLGKFCEFGKTEEIFNPPNHPYTQALLSAIPIADPEAKRETLRLTGRMPSSVNPPTGCRFHTRCPRKVGKICETEEPPEQKTSETHKIYCHISINDLMKFKPVISP